MKKILQAIVIAAHVILFCSCEKKMCYECTATTTSTGGGAMSTVTANETFCDMTPRDIDKVERDGTYTSTETYGNITVITTTETNCK